MLFFDNLSLKLAVIISISESTMQGVNKCIKVHTDGSWSSKRLNLGPQLTKSAYSIWLNITLPKSAQPIVLAISITF